MQGLDTWLARIETGNTAFRTQVGSVGIALFRLAIWLLAAPRMLRKRFQGGETSRALPDLQRPWLPRWPSLAAAPVHNRRQHAWTRHLQAAFDDIRGELDEVRQAFERARYDSDLNPKPWHTYYFYFRGKPEHSHLAACPRTAEMLGRIPHNGLHVCFSAIEPGGALHPHTGPTNASLTAHLGLANCAGARLTVAGETAEYRDGEVLVFDDSFVHWVENTGTAVRYTLMVTFWHPELNRLERAFFRRLVLAFPG